MKKDRLNKIIIAISGTPGTGKSTLAKKLSLLLKITRMDIDRYIMANKLYSGYDKLRKTKIVSETPLKRSLSAYIRQSETSLIIDSHLAHILPSSLITLTIITSCKLKPLQQRLKKRRYNQLKIRENLDAEIFDTCYTEAVESGHRVLKSIQLKLQKSKKS